MSNKIETAKKLYLEGIGDGKVRESVTKYTGDRYTQHSAGVADGIEGFVEFFEPFVERCTSRDIQIKRAFVDGNFVFVHVYQDINNGEAKWVTADIFDTDDNDKIVEHWDIIQAYEEKTVSGRTMVDGPTEIEDLDKTVENKALIQNFFDDVLIGGKFQKVTDYISTEQYDQHNPSVGDGLEGFGKHVQEMTDKGISSSYEKLHILIGQGNFVATLSHTKVSGEDWAFIDLFRIKDGKIVEHWDIQEKIMPKDQWGNSGKF
jgi:predicted SnoaL-like aldol condensation-catalyzing enzyme